MTRDELEFLISQHLDGDISATDETRLQACLIEDAEARATMTEYRSLQHTMHQVRSEGALQLRGIDFAALKRSINTSIDNAAQRTLKLDDYRPAAQAASAGRKSNWLFRYGSIAAAAVVVVGFGFYAYHNLPSRPQVAVNSSDAPKDEKPAGASPSPKISGVGSPSPLSPSLTDHMHALAVDTVGNAGHSLLDSAMAVRQAFKVATPDEMRAMTLPSNVNHAVAGVQVGMPVGVSPSAILSLVNATRMHGVSPSTRPSSITTHPSDQ